MKKELLFFLDLNYHEVERLDLSKDKIDKLKEIFTNLTPNEFFEKIRFPLDIVLLKDTEGGSAYIQKNTFPYKQKYDLFTRVPLSLTMRQQRSWASAVSNFFKPCLSKESERVLKNAPFKKILKQPYKESEFESYDPDNPKDILHYKERVITYANKVPHGTKSNRSSFYKKRNIWIKNQYAILRKEKIPATECYTLIAEKLSKLPSGFFGKTIRPKNTKPFNLSTKRVQFIIQSTKV